MTKTMSKLHKLKAQQRVQNTLNARNGSETIQTLSLVLSLGSKFWIYQKKKTWIRSFKVLSIADIDITIDIGNGLASFWNTHMKPYHCHIEDTDINFSETTNDLEENPIDKPTNAKIPMSLDYLEPEKSCH